MAKSTAREIAATLLELAAGSEITDVSNLKLQKLVYYAQAWHLALYGPKLFEDRIEAWVHGPVVADVFRDYKHNRWASISAPLAPPSRAPVVRKHVQDVLSAYGALTATELERLTHREKPWIEARGGLPADVPSRAEIRAATMKTFYSRLIV